MDIQKEKKPNKHTVEELRLLQALPLELKVEKTKLRILEWVREFGVDGVYVSFSGGKDSTVLLHIVRSMFPEIEAVFVDTGLEYPEIRQFVKRFDNVKILHPKMNFMQVIQNYGYPIISKEVAHKIQSYRDGKAWAVPYVEGTAKRRDGSASCYNVKKYKPIARMDFLVTNYCCDIMKKTPFHGIDSKPFTAEMAEESMQRKSKWIKYGCNVFDGSVQKSKPMSFWKEQDVLHYITENNLAIAPPYGEIVPASEKQLSFFDDCSQCKLCTTGLDRTGCMFCGFGAHLEKGETRFQRMKHTHPKLYNYCIYGGAYGSDGIWKPDKNGLGMKHVFEELNKIYGENFIRYE